MRLWFVILLALTWVDVTPAHADGDPLVPPVRPVGGPDSVNSALRYQYSKKESFFRFHVLESSHGPLYRFRQRMKARHRIALGLDYNVLYQGASASLRSNESAGGAFRFYGNWEVFGGGTPTTSEVVFRLEHRHGLGTPVAPERFGGEIGSLLKTANSFSDFGWGITNLQWQQWFEDGRYGVALGRVDLRDWVDTFDLSNWRAALLSAAVTYPTNPLPSAGFGGAVVAYLRDANTPYVLAGVGDANGHPDEVGFESFFHTREYYSFVELGWTPSFERKDHDNLRLTYWHQDARKAHGTGEGWGLSFSANWKFQKKWAPFLRGGWAEGGVISTQTALVAGLGIHRRSHDLFGVALGWAKPYDESLRDQVTLETFYRLQLSQHIGITPDIELLFNPSNNPDESLIAVFGIRFQLAL